MMDAKVGTTGVVVMGADGSVVMIASNQQQKKRTMKVIIVRIVVKTALNSRLLQVNKQK
jgi:hypothetical protein